MSRTLGGITGNMVKLIDALVRLRHVLRDTEVDYQPDRIEEGHVAVIYAPGPRG